MSWASSSLLLLRNVNVGGVVLYSSAAEAAKVEGVDGKFLSKIAIGNISSATFQTITIESCFKLIHILACTRLFSPPVPYSSSSVVCVGVWMNERSLGC